MATKRKKLKTANLQLAPISIGIIEAEIGEILSTALNSRGTNIRAGNTGAVSRINDLLTGGGGWIFGDGSDGNATISGTTTLTQDMNYKRLEIASGGTLNTAGYRVYAQEGVFVYGTIDRSGNAGSAGGASSDQSGGGATAGGSGGAGGGALSAANLAGS